MIFGSLVKAKVLAMVLAGVAVVGGGTVALAATPAGQHAWQAITGKAASTKTPEADQEHHDNGKSCAGDSDARQILASFALSTDTKSDPMQAVCELHAGHFKGKTPAGAEVSTTRVYGYGEIAKLLTYASYLATHDSATNNPSGKLDDANTRAYLAQALQSCGSTPLEKCLMEHIPGYHPGNGNGTGDDNHTGTDGGGGNGNGNGTGGNGNGKPEGTPTPQH